MKVIANARELQPGSRRICAAIGVFDGVHLGHQQVIHQTVSDARQHDALAMVITFDCHPATVVAPEQAPAMIYPLTRKLRLIEETRVDATLLLHFDHAFSQQTGEAFIRSLAQDCGQIFSLCVGSNFTFGHQRTGNLALLKKLGQELKFIAHGHSAVSLGGKTVSSTRIREAIRDGYLEGASQMLGRPYSLIGSVVHGDHLGRQWGFPTANLATENLALPPRGVYAVNALVRGECHPAVLNIGFRPTLKQPHPTWRVEAHLLDFQGDLYGAELELVFLGKLRDEQAFSSPEALREQIARDIAAARTMR
jgi:riboflavin kinase / FMN adenylyltransferase